MLQLKLKLNLIGASLVMALSVIAHDRLAASDLQWLVGPPPAGNTFGAAR